MRNNLFKFNILIVCLVFLANISFSQKTAPKVDLGKLRQNTYTNDFFELKIEFPTGWLVGDNGLEAPLMEIQKASVQTKNAKDQAALNKAMNRVTPLLGGYKAMPGSVEENSNMRIVVENLVTTPQIKTSRDYLKAMLATLRMTKLPPNYSISGIEFELIDGKIVNYIEAKYLTSQRRSYVIVKKRFAVLITIDAYNQTEFDALHQVWEKSDLDYKK